MKRNSSLLIVLFISGFYLAAAHRTPNQALEVVSKHISTNSKMQRMKASEKEVKLVYEKSTHTNPNQSALYIFNIGDDSGYVIVSGDDRAKTVLGYADRGSFDPDCIPDGLTYWLGFYTEEINALPVAQVKQVALDKDQNNQDENSPTEAQALLGDIKWNQSAPYNNLAPLIPNSTQRTVSGCVATGMAQVMRYHMWPTKGAGSNSYTTETHGIAISQNFSNTTYDWINMTPTYGNTSSSTEQNAVATLVYHCGVAVNMDFAASSGANSRDMGLALVNNFGYDANLNLAYRDYYNREDWTMLIRNEITSGRPILYSGQSSTGGHLFVCDGYDANNLFHFNWGWGGLSNGYYEISALNPGSQGIGGSSGGYNSSQNIVVGMQKPSVNSTPNHVILMQKPPTSSTETISRNAETTITLNSIFNIGIQPYNGYFALGLYNNNNELIQVLNTTTINNLDSYRGWNSLNLNVSIPSTVADGNYRLFGIMKESTENEWEIIRGKVGTPNFLHVVASSTQVSYLSANDYKPNLVLNDLTSAGNVYQGKKGRFSMTISNSGEEYNSVLAIYLQSVTDESVYQLFTEDANIAKGETRTVYLNEDITMAPGSYNLYAMYDKFNNRSEAITVDQLGESKTIQIKAVPTDPPNLTLLSPIHFQNNLAVDRNNAVLSANIKNTSGYFDDNIIAFIFPKEGGNSLDYLGYQNISFDTDEVKTLSLGGNIDLEPNQYTIGLYYWNSSVESWSRITPNENSFIGFTLVNSVTNIEIPHNIDELKLFPNPAQDLISFYSDEPIVEIRVYDLKGHLQLITKPSHTALINIDISKLSVGKYIIQARNRQSIRVSQFIKTHNK